MSKNRSSRLRPDVGHLALATTAALALGFSVGNIGNEPERVAPIVEVVEVQTSSTSIERVPIDEERAGEIIGRTMSESFDFGGGR